MIEIFKTNVTNNENALNVIQMLEKLFPDYIMNFDLDDCDNILRIETNNNSIDCDKIIYLLNDFGQEIELLLD